jgi:putative FmdB family regulatory protein
MPIYEYRCESCANEFDKLMKMGAPNPPCQICQGETKRMLSAAAFHLKGGGWAKEGYGSRQRTVAGNPSVNPQSLPYVTRDGGLASADGKKILNSDGSAAS